MLGCGAAWGEDFFSGPGVSQPSESGGGGDETGVETRLFDAADIALCAEGRRGCVASPESLREDVEDEPSSPQGSSAAQKVSADTLHDYSTHLD